jgi:Ni,Fe-hydrogenase maturation factor
LPDEVVFWGVQIEDLGVGLELSRPVAAQVETLAHKVLEELAQWEIYATAKGGATAAAGV